MDSWVNTLCSIIFSHVSLLFSILQHITPLWSSFKMLHLSVPSYNILLLSDHYAICYTSLTILQNVTPLWPFFNMLHLSVSSLKSSRLRKSINGTLLYFYFMLWFCYDGFLDLYLCWWICRYTVYKVIFTYWST